MPTKAYRTSLLVVEQATARFTNVAAGGQIRRQLVQNAVNKLFALGRAVELADFNVLVDSDFHRDAPEKLHLAQSHLAREIPW